MSDRLTSRLARRLLILWLGLRGSVEIRLVSRPEDLEQARRTFDRLAQVDEDSFLAQLQLGRIAERRREAGAALVHYGRAHEIDALRFERSSVSADLKRRVLARQRLIRAGLQAPETPAAVSRNDPPAAGTWPAGGGDFSSADEYRRFRGRPPISREEIARVDMDDLLRRLGRGD